MTAQKRSTTGAMSTQAAPQGTGFTFPARLIHPPQSQVARTEDSVTACVTELDAFAQKLGQGFGIAFTSFTLNPMPEPKETSGVAAIGYIAMGMTRREERVTLERRSGRWGLYFTREASLIGRQDQRVESVSLKDAPLDVRERFLLKSEEFFRLYLAQCQDRLGKMHECVSAGERTIGLLQQLRLTE